MRLPCAYAVCVRWIAWPASCRACTLEPAWDMIRAHGLRAFTVMILWASCAALPFDAALVSQGLRQSSVAKQAIKDGHVTVSGKVIKKAAFSVDDAMLVDIRLEDGADAAALRLTRGTSCVLRLTHSKSAWTEARTSLTSEPQQVASQTACWMRVRHRRRASTVDTTRYERASASGPHSGLTLASPKLRASQTPPPCSASCSRPPRARSCTSRCAQTRV